MLRRLAAAAMVTGCILAMSAVAGAHVEINADGPPADDNVLTTSVFVEGECAGFTQTAQLVFPEEPALTVGIPVEVDGWTAAVAKRAGSDDLESVTWTNTGGAGGDANFDLAIGEISSDQKPITIKAIQTCDDGEVFRWIEEGDGAEFPAPVLAIDHRGHMEDDGHAHSDGHPHDGGSDKKAASASETEDDGSSSTGVIIAVVAGVIVLGGGGLYMARRAKQAS